MEKIGTVIEVQPHDRIIVRDRAGKVYDVASGQNKSEGAAVGDAVLLRYVSRAHAGLWYAFPEGLQSESMAGVFARLEEAKQDGLDWDSVMANVTRIFLQNRTDAWDDKRGKYRVFRKDPEGGFVTLINVHGAYGGGESKGKFALVPGWPTDYTSFAPEVVPDPKKDMQSFRILARVLGNFFEVNERPRIADIMGARPHGDVVRDARSRMFPEKE